ncbi:hypothetical protein HG531_008698 [Fusarium graminearum]|nr:hypothetical protein HG531_008698 [Fusarium graminearum]
MLDRDIAKRSTDLALVVLFQRLICLVVGNIESVSNTPSEVTICHARQLVVCARSLCVSLKLLSFDKQVRITHVQLNTLSTSAGCFFEVVEGRGGVAGDFGEAKLERLAFLWSWWSIVAKVHQKLCIPFIILLLERSLFCLLFLLLSGLSGLEFSFNYGNMTAPIFAGEFNIAKAKTSDCFGVGVLVEIELDVILSFVLFVEATVNEASLLCLPGFAANGRSARDAKEFLLVGSEFESKLASDEFLWLLCGLFLLPGSFFSRKEFAPCQNMPLLVGRPCGFE